MEPVLGVTALWLAFAGTHIGLATRRVRGALVARLGEWGFIGLFSLVASLTYAALVHFYAMHRLTGAPGLALGAVAWLRPALIATVFLGLTIAIASFSSYPASPYAVGSQRTRQPAGLEHVTRHPFFVGIGLVGAAHALLASRLVGTAFFGILAVYSLVGAAHQDRKLLAQRGRPYADYLAATSFLPFGALVAGRRLPWSELPWLGFTIAAASAGLLLAAHDSIFAYGGAWVIGATVGGAAVLSFQSWRAATRRASGLRRGFA